MAQLFSSYDQFLFGEDQVIGCFLINFSAFEAVTGKITVHEDIAPAMNPAIAIFLKTFMADN